MRVGTRLARPACLTLGLAFAIAIAILGGVAAPAHAETQPPWFEGVSKSSQTHAMALFKEGNDLFLQGKYADALVPFEKAVKLWDHPSIQYNLALCLFNIRQPLEAWDHLERALRYGERGPLGARLYGDAMTYRALLESSLAQLEVTTDQDAVQIELDGRQLLTGPGKTRVRLLAGSHQLVATHDGFKTESRALDLPAGKVSTEAITLEKDVVKVEVTKIRENYERRWAWWVPWATTGGAVVVALAATGVYLDARSGINAYDAELATKCPAGCTPSQISMFPGLSAKETSAEHLGEVGIGMWVGAAAIGAVAGTMAYLNRPKLVEHQDPAKPVDAPSVMVTPIVAPGWVGVGVGVTLR